MERNKKRKKQKILGILLAAALTLSSVDITAAAAAPDTGTAGAGTVTGTTATGAGQAVPADNDAPTQDTAQTTPADNDAPAEDAIQTTDAEDTVLTAPATYADSQASVPTTVTEWPDTSGTSNSSWLFKGDLNLDKNEFVYFYGSGNTITINGNLTLTNGATICMDQSSSQNQLIVKGDVKIIQAEGNSHSGIIRMEGSDNTLTVEGSLKVKELSGNNATKIFFSQYGKNNALLIQKDMVLDGCQGTAVGFHGATDASLTVEGNLTLDGCTGNSTIQFYNPNRTAFTVKGNMTLNSGDIHMAGADTDNFIVNGDCKLNGGTVRPLRGSMTVKGGFQQEGGSLEIGGTLEVNGDFTENGGTLILRHDYDAVVHIKGSFLQNGGTNELRHGKFTVDGSFQMGTAGEMQDGYRLATSTGSATLGRYNNTHYSLEMNVGGDMVICTSGSFRSYSNYWQGQLNGGATIRLGGNLYQYGNYNLGNATAYGYAPSDNFQAGDITFTGAGKQRIFMDSTDSYFSHLGAQNTDLWVDTAIKFLNLGSDVTLHVDPTAEYHTFLLDSFDPSLQGHTLTIDGSVRHDSGTISYNGGKMIVTGDYTMGAKGEPLEEYIAKTSTGSINQGKGTLAGTKPGPEHHGGSRCI